MTRDNSLYNQKNNVRRFVLSFIIFNREHDERKRLQAIGNGFQDVWDVVVLLIEYCSKLYAFYQIHY